MVRVSFRLLAAVALVALGVDGSVHARTLEIDARGRAGRAVAFVGGQLAVGAPDRFVPFARSGAVDLYDLDGTLAATRTTPPGVPAADGDDFGFALADADGKLVVGAPGADLPGKLDAGRVFVFDAAGVAVELDPGDRAAGDRFGYAVAALGTSIIVGAPGSDAAAPDAGAVYVFPTGGPVRKLTLGTFAKSGDALGYAVASHAASVLAGAPRVISEKSGAAFLFDPATGSVVATFTSPSADEADHFGASVASNGGAVVVGAPFDDTFGDDAGIAYVFPGANPSIGVPRGEGAAKPGTLFGTAVAIAGGDVVVGAPLDSGAGFQSGAVYRIDISTGSIEETLKPPTSEGFEMLGQAIAVGGDAIALGAGFRNRVYLIVCGDGVRDPGEICDGTDDAACDDGCAAFTCECAPPSTCGDGIFVAGPEECDDGNTVACDGCSPTCRTELGAQCGDDVPNLDCEQCDDGNLTAGDGCSPQCRFECTTPSDCLDRVDPADRICVFGATCTAGECVYEFPPFLQICVGDPFTGAKCCSKGRCSLDCFPATTTSTSTSTSTCTTTTTTLPVVPCQLDGDCDNLCLTPRVCVDGFCAWNSLVSCDDGDRCTGTDCNPAIGCTYPREPGCCDDDADCNDECRSEGTCKICNYCDVFEYGEACCARSAGTRTHCRGGTPTGAPSCTADVDPCTADRCDDRTCVVGPIDRCDDDNPCTDDMCDPALGCVNAPSLAAEGMACGNPCTGDHCMAGACVPGEPLVCDDGNPCTTDLPCDGEKAIPCYAVPIVGCCDENANCQDTDLCTSNERCVDGTCASDRCSTSEPCTVVSCLPAEGCRLNPARDGDPCPSDVPGDACIVGNAQCRSGACVPDRACEVTTRVQSPDLTPTCKKAAKRIRIFVDCATIGDEGGTRKQRRKSKCQAVATASGTVIGKGKRQSLASGQATVAVQLTKGGVKKFCAAGRLDAIVAVSLVNRQGRAFEVERSVALP